MFKNFPFSVICQSGFFLQGNTEGCSEECLGDIYAILDKYVYQDKITYIPSDEFYTLMKRLDIKTFEKNKYKNSFCIIDDTELWEYIIISVFYQDKIHQIMME